MYKFDHRPSAREIEETVEFHNYFYDDYCNVTFDDGTKRKYKNTEPAIYYYSKSDFRIDFHNPILRQEGISGKLGIIRSKRVILEKKKGES